MLLTGEKSPDTALRIKEVEQNIWRHTISSAAALAAGPPKNLICHVCSPLQRLRGRADKEGDWASWGGNIWEDEAFWIMTAKRL